MSKNREEQNRIWKYQCTQCGNTFQLEGWKRLSVCPGCKRNDWDVGIKAGGNEDGA